MGSKTPTMPNTIFFSWQADTKTRSGRNFIERALTHAASRISEDTEVEDAVREELTVDRDTMGVAGSRPIVDTIFRPRSRRPGRVVPPRRFISAFGFSRFEA